MDLPPWLIFRQASEAVANGRPDEAHRLIAPLVDEGYRKAWRLARDVAGAYCARARRALDRDHNPGAAWRDLLAAEALNTGEKCVTDLRQTLSRFGLVQARGELEAGSPVAAVERVGQLRDRGVRHPDLRRVEEVAQDWVMAAEKADRGDFLPALADLDRLRPRLPCPPTGLDRYRAEVERRHERFRAAVGRAHEAAGAKRWRAAISAAEEALSAAPEHREARTLRTKAWQAAYPEAGECARPPGAADPVDPFALATFNPDTPDPPSGPGLNETASARAHLAVPRLSAGVPRSAARPDEPAGSRTTPYDPTGRPDRAGWVPSGAGSTGVDESGRGAAPGGEPGSDRSPLPKRFLLWIDGVAGYLVCTGTRVTFGQAALAGGPVDIPLFADVSRVHADIARDGEGYLVESGKAAPVYGKEVARMVQVNGKEVGRAVLAAGDRVTLGATCQFLFHRPVSVSSTARLALTSGHRLMFPVEGVLLMANEVILGPAPHAHVVVPDLPGKVLLYRSKDGLGVRVPGGKFRVNDRPYTDRAPLPLPASFEADTLTFTVEPVGPRV
ncbi:MAG: hypothetical protein JWO38_7506 [Gemmataceae bacterium]|nr:hypothetical protein [Gemmataceae bacterium]